MRTTTEERLEDVARAADSVVNAAVQDFRACVADVENAEKVHAEMRAKKWAVEKRLEAAIADSDLAWDALERHREGQAGEQAR